MPHLCLHWHALPTLKSSPVELWVLLTATLSPCWMPDKVQHKIRLAGIDAPEKKQPFGNRSKESLSALTFDKTVNVETDKRDKYGRQVGKVLVNGQDVNLVQVERGMAWFYRQYQREQSPNDRRLYETAEDAAKAKKRGIWRDADPVPPWEFRHVKHSP